MLSLESLSPYPLIPVYLYPIINLSPGLLTPSTPFPRVPTNRHRLSPTRPYRQPTPANKNRCKKQVQKIAGRIVPALATTTSLVAGLVTLEIVKIAAERVRSRRANSRGGGRPPVDPAADSARLLNTFRNTFANLARPLLAFAQVRLCPAWMSPLPRISTHIQARQLPCSPWRLRRSLSWASVSTCGRPSTRPCPRPRSPSKPWTRTYGTVSACNCSPSPSVTRCCTPISCLTQTTASA